MLLEYTAYHCKHEERERVCHDGAAYGYAHALQSRQAVAEHKRVGYERVGGIHGCHQYGCGSAEPEYYAICQIADGHRYGKTEKPQCGRFAFDALHVLQVHFQRGEKHDVVESHLSEKFETAVALEHMKSVRADEYTRENHAYDRRYA